jgi:hypothetical protein
MTSPLAVVALQAVHYARSKIPNTWNRSSDFDRLVADNKAANREEAERMLKEDLRKRRAEVSAIVKPKLQPVVKSGYTVFGSTFFAGIEPPEFLDGDDKIMHTGKLAEQHRLGNCGEMAAVAYSFLRAQGTAGVHYVNMQYARRGVHIFVVIGANSIIQENNYIDRTLDQAKRAFGNGAIICDPWLGDKGTVFEVDRWQEAVDQMIAEVAPKWNGSDEITFVVTARSSALTREQKVERWKTKQP